MASRCPECGTENQPGVRTCEFCNAALPAAGTTAKPPGAESSRRRAEAERRLKASRRRELIATPALALLALVLLALVIVYFPKKQVTEAAPDLILDYPSVAIDRYYSAVKQADWESAHGLLASAIATSVSAEALAQAYGPRAVTSHSLQDLGQADEVNAYAAVTVNGRPGFVWMVREQTGWRIHWTTELGDALGLPCPV